MGPDEASLVGLVEGTVKYHSWQRVVLPPGHESGWETVSGGQFDWGGRLLKGNGGAQRFPQAGWKSAIRVQRQKGA